ncbi:MAG: hypothetical protein OEU94_16055, partial [Aquincola sp.]|nr:hypothetical protein [Aquincola sp.]
PAPLPPGTTGRFRLMRFFTLATLLVFVAVAVTLFLLQRQEEDFFVKAQLEQRQFFAQAQADLARRNEEAARRSLLAVHEASHVNLTRIVANLMWQTDFAPLVRRAQRFSIEQCRARPAGGANSDALAAARKACHADLGRRIVALPGFEALDRKAYAAMRASTVFKIKVFDLRGVTVYSSERAQIGEDGAANQGWRAAVAGRPASELTHRTRFSAFERVVENRDLISSYVPVRAGPVDAVVGVFELYSDVTPFLAQTQAASKAFAENIAANQAQVDQTAQAKLREVKDNSVEFLAIVGGLIVLLYLASLAIVRIGQRFIDRQTLAQEQAAAREQLWHREKMAALSAMAANVSHEVGNPLAVISGVAQALPDAQAATSRQILEQTSRIAAMTRKIADFAGAPGDAAETVDINPIIEAVCEFQTFDRRFRRKPLQFLPGAGLPACHLVPDHLNEVMMNLLQACADRTEPEGLAGGIRVTTIAAPGGAVCIDIARFSSVTEAELPVGDLSADQRYELARRRVGDMGGRLVASPARVRVVLPAAAPALA